jgi:hypothetical protein
MYKKWTIPDVAKVIFKEEAKQLFIFNKALASINSDSPTMVELGAAEGLYSLIFKDYFIKNKILPINVCVEMCLHKLDVIKEYIPSAITYHSYVGDLDQNDSDVKSSLSSTVQPSKITLKEIVTQNSLQKIDILHADIQGSENTLIDEIKNESLHKNIHYMFISTHDHIVPNVHKKILDTIFSFNNFKVIINVDDTEPGYGYGDGLIICKNLNYYEKVRI